MGRRMIFGVDPYPAKLKRWTTGMATDCDAIVACFQATYALHTIFLIESESPHPIGLPNFSGPQQQKAGACYLVVVMFIHCK